MAVKTALILAAALVFAGCSGNDEKAEVTTQASDASPMAMEILLKLEHASSEHERFIWLSSAAIENYKLGRSDLAEDQAIEALSLLPKYTKSFNYANTFNDAHTVLGWVALDDGDVARAKSHLLESGKCGGSPQLSSFGPQMGLAKDLLARGERQAVLDYFDLCSTFWSPRTLKKWAEEVKAGKTPKFRNL